ncbi:MAG TPA: hypothetical protein VEC37_03255 [Bacillota bacterium]|nr:hypothetical protein [Bacillota bacterium]
MTSSANPKTLQMVVKNEWAVDSISSLGSGYCSFLAYQYDEVDPEVLDDIRARQIGEGVWGEIIHVKKSGSRRVALVEIKQVNDFDSFVRFDFMILNVAPFLRNGVKPCQSSYKCFYKENPV